MDLQELVLNIYGLNLTIDIVELIFLQILTTAIMIMWFETFGIGQRLKVLFGWKPMDYVKPFDCRFCTHFWIGTIISIIFLNPFLFILNILISQLYEKNSNT